MHAIFGEVVDVIITHMSVDLDAVMSVLAVREFAPGGREADIQFRPANWDGEDAPANVLILDMDARGKGIKGDRGEGGKVHSCFATIIRELASPEDQLALAPLVKFVDVQDSSGYAARYLLPGVDNETIEIFGRTGINAVFRAMQSIVRGDQKVILAMEQIFKGLLKNGRDRLKALEEAKQIERIGNVALLINARSKLTHRILLEDLGVKAVVYVDGYNLGVVRSGFIEGRIDHPDIFALIDAVGEREKWFVHTAGWLMAHGTTKAPAKEISKVDPRVLAQTADRLLA